MNRQPRSQRAPTPGATVPLNDTTSSVARTEAPTQRVGSPGPIRVSGAKPPVARTTPKRKGNSRSRDILLIVGGVIGVALLLWLLSSGIGTSNTVDPGTTAASAPTSAALTPGATAPNFTLPDTTGKMVSLSDYAGKPMVIEFFAPWCPHCQNDAPIFNSLYDAWNPKGVDFLAVSATPFGRNYESGDQSAITADDVKWFSSNFNVKFPMLFDKDIAQAKVYGIDHFPFVYILNGKGLVSAVPDNPTDTATMNTLIQTAIDQGK